MHTYHVHDLCAHAVAHETGTTPAPFRIEGLGFQGLGFRMPTYYAHDVCARAHAVDGVCACTTRHGCD
jgi:hypothetical protein